MGTIKGEFNLDVAGVVVLFNPNAKVVEAIYTYIASISHLYVYDNSDVIDNDLVNIIRKIPKVSYFGNQNNDGIATALNKMAKVAIGDGFNKLLTMDQDSYFNERDIIQFVKIANCLNWTNIGLITPVHDFGTLGGSVNDSDESRMVKSCMTSGNIINLEAFDKINGFNDSFFIDHVDHEYCYKLKIAGYDILEFPNIQLKHALGESKTLKRLGMKVGYISHSPIRSYYYIRNGLRILSDYNIERPRIFRLLIKDIFKNIFLEKSKMSRLTLMKKAIRDYSKKKGGKYE